MSFGQGKDRSWDDAMKFGFVSAGGGSWYSNTLNLLKPNDRIWVKAPGYGFVGVGRVKGPAEAATDFRVMIDGKEQLAAEGLSGAEYHRRYMTDPEKMEYFVPVEWAQNGRLEKRTSARATSRNESIGQVAVLIPDVNSVRRPSNSLPDQTP